MSFLSKKFYIHGFFCNPVLTILKPTSPISGFQNVISQNLVASYLLCRGSAVVVRPVL